MAHKKTAFLRQLLSTVKELEGRKTGEATLISLGFIIADAVITVAEILQCIAGQVSPEDQPLDAEILSRAIAEGWRGEANGRTSLGFSPKSQHGNLFNRRWGKKFEK